MSTKPADAQYWIERKKKFEIKFRNLISRSEIVHTELRQEWEKFYIGYFNLKKDFSQLAIPEPQPGFDCFIIEAGELTNSQVYYKCKSLFPAGKYTDDLNSITDVAPWQPGDRAYWIRNCVEADEELKNLSANQLAEKKIVGITLKGRLLYELKYFRETGKHLDIAHWTLCSGSRYQFGGVPYVGWKSDRLNVFWYGSDYSDAHLRCRAVVS